MATAGYPTSLSSPNTSGAALQSRLDALARRRNAQKMGRALISAAIPGVALAAISVLLFKLHLIQDGPLWAPAAIVGTSLLWGFRQGLRERAGSFVAACDADLALGLDNRLGSALSFVAPAQTLRATKNEPQKGRLAPLKAIFASRVSYSSAPIVPPTGLVPALVDEAAVRAQNLDPKRVYPLPFDRRAGILTALSLLLVGFVAMPDFPLFQTPAQKKQVAAMQNAGEKLIAVAKTVQKNPAPKAEEVQQLSRRLENLGQKMMRGRITKRAALTEMGQLRQELEKATKPPKNSGAQNDGSPQIAEALRQAPLQSQSGRKVQQQLAQNKWDEAAKELENLADKVEKGELSQSEKQKAADDLEKTARDLRSRGGEANQKAAEKLEGAANQLRQPQSQDGQSQNSPDKGQKQGENSQQNGQQNPQSQNGQNSQGQQNQPGQQPQNGQQNSQGQQNNQNQQNPAGGQQGQQPQNGQSQNGQQQNGQSQQNQSGQQGGSQGQSPQQQPPQNGGQQGGQSGQQGQQSQGQQGGQGAADALRDMANGLRNGASSGSNSQNLQDMMNKLRDAENQTGSNGGQQSGQGKPSQSGQGGQNGTPGDGKMQGVTPGKDIQPSDPRGQVGGGPGLGPRNNAQGVQSGGGVSKLKSKRTGDKRRYQDIWSDRLPKTRKKIDRVTGKWGDSGEVEQMPTRGEGKGGQVKTPYYEVYESYKRDAEDAVGRESVPPAYKQPVKDYFESIKP
ncbi:MAG TPA: hypothetical protein VGB45_00490 [Abditibacterium sp.]